MPAVNDVGELGAGEPHAQFDGGRLETERRPLVRGEMCSGETPGMGAGTYRRSTPPRQPPTQLTHICGKRKNGRFWLKRKTASKRALRGWP